MSHYLEQGSLLRPEKLSDTPMIAVDLELTGLDAASNQIISVGWTHLDQGRIRFGSNRHILVNAEQSVGHSAAIHELTDTEVSTGVKPRDALESLFEAAAGRAWVFHHAGLDVSFLQSACREWFGLKPPFAVLDTMQLELGLRKRREQPVQQGDLPPNCSWRSRRAWTRTTILTWRRSCVTCSESQVPDPKHTEEVE